MAASSTARANLCAWPPRLHPLCGCALALFLAPNIDAVRSGGGAVSSDASMDASLASTAPVPLAPESAAARTKRGRDLRTAADYVDAINVQDYHHLADIQDTLEHLEDVRVRLTSFRAARDPHHRQIRKILRDVEQQADALKVMAGKLEADGEADDGGEELPTQRDNICSRSSKYGVQSQFAELVQLLCEWLDGVREAVSAGEDEEPIAYSGSGLFNALTREPDYRQGHIGLEIERVLGEERRWVTKHLTPQPAGTGSGWPSPEGTGIRLRRWAPRMWQAQIWEDVEGDTAAMTLMALKAAKDTLVSVAVDDNLSLSYVHSRIERLQNCKTELAEFISSSDLAIREGIRDVLQEIKARIDALRALAALKVEAGEIDNSSELLPSQRENLCAKLDAFALEKDFREDIRKICETFDRMHLVANLDLERDKGGFEVLGRIAAIRCKPGYWDTHVAVEFEHFIAEEWDLLFEQEAVVDA